MTWRCLALAFALTVLGVNSDPSSTTTTTFTVKSMDSTTLNKKASKGDTTIEVFNTGNFDVGSELIIGFKNVIQETHKVKSRSVASGVGILTLEEALENDHEAMAPVVSVEPMPVLIPMPLPVPVPFPSTPAPTAAPTAAPTPVPAVETTMTTAVEAGATELSVADVTGFAAGDEITIGSAPTQETATIKSVLEATSAGRRLATAGILTLDAALKYSHASEATVVKSASAPPPAPTAAPTPAPTEAPTTTAEMLSGSMSRRLGLGLAAIAAALGCLALLCLLLACLCCGGKKQVRSTKVKKRPVPPVLPPAEPVPSVVEEAAPLFEFGPPLVDFGLALPPLMPTAALAPMAAPLPIAPAMAPVTTSMAAPIIDMKYMQGTAAMAAPVVEIAPPAPVTTSMAAPIIDMKYMGGAAAPTLGYGTSSGYEVVSQVF